MTKIRKSHLLTFFMYVFILNFLFYFLHQLLLVSLLLCFLHLLLSVNLLAPEEDSLCQKRSCIIVSFFFVVLVSILPYICSIVVEGQTPWVGMETAQCSHGERHQSHAWRQAWTRCDCISENEARR